MTHYSICCSQDWFDPRPLQNLFPDHTFDFISEKSQLSIEKLEKTAPEKVFFVHWNWIVPANIVETHNCVLFHTAPLPVGRGGSPIQNLILNGFREAPVCALKMVNELDAGPIYAREMISLDGPLHAIFARVQTAVEQLMHKIIEESLTPTPQQGDPIIFQRRKPEESVITSEDHIDQLYDKIRMVDGGTYPRAHIDRGDFRVAFTDANICDGTLTAKATFIKNDTEKEGSELDKRLTDNKYGLVFTSITATTDKIETLYHFFNARASESRISSQPKLSLEQHTQFVKNHPYRYWFMISRDGVMIASLYLRFDNTLSLQMIDFTDCAYEQSLELVLQAIQPLPALPSVRPANFFINLAPNNDVAAEKLREIGMRPIQTTYVL